jgi:hypothetical protein
VTVDGIDAEQAMDRETIEADFVDCYNLTGSNALRGSDFQQLRARMGVRPFRSTQRARRITRHRFAS